MNCRSDVSPTQSPCMEEQPTNRFSISTPLFSLSDKEKHNNRRTATHYGRYRDPRVPSQDRAVGSGLAVCELSFSLTAQGRALPAPA